MRLRVLVSERSVAVCQDPWVPCTFFLWGSEDGALAALTRRPAAAKPVSSATCLQSSQYNKSYMFKPLLVGYLYFQPREVT